MCDYRANYRLRRMKTKPYIFWIRSSRGTDDQAVVRIDSSLKKISIRDELERWCGSFGAWHVSENFVSYGWAVANKANLNKLSKYHDMKQAKHTQLDLLRKKAITIKGYDTWLKKNKKKAAFPFK